MSPAPGPRKRSWKGGGESPSTAAGWRRKDWQGRSDAPDPGAIPWWKTRVARIGFVFSLLVGVFAVTVLVIRWWQPVPPARLVLIGAGYEDNLAVPHNVPGRRGLDALAGWAEAHNERVGNSERERIDVHRVELGDDDEAVIQHLLKGSWWARKPPTVVVVVAAHGVAAVDEEGFSPCLVHQDDNLRDRATLYRLDRLLDALEQLPKTTKKLLILDVTRSAHTRRSASSTTTSLAAWKTAPAAFARFPIWWSSAAAARTSAPGTLPSKA